MKSNPALNFFQVGRAARPTLLCFCILAGAGLAHADTPRKGAEEMALRLLSVARNAPEVLQAQSELNGRAADIRAAELQKYPKLEVETSLGKSNSQLPNTLAVANSRVTAGVRYTVFDAGKSDARLAAARSGVQIGEHRFRRTSDTVIFDAMSAYLQILRFELLVSVARSSEQALRDIEVLEARKLALGGAGVTDSKVAATRLALSASKLFQFQSALEDARTSFSALFGFTPVEGELPVARVSSAWLKLDSEGVTSEALSNNPEIAEANSSINLAQANVSAERASRFPSVDVTVTKIFEFPGAVSAPPRLGVQLSLSSGAALEAGSRAAKAVAQVNADEARLDVVKREVTQRALAAWRLTITGYQREQVLAEAAIGSGDVFKARKRLNSAGRETTMVVLDAQVEQNNVYIEWVAAIFDARLAELRLARELGKLSPMQGAGQDWAESFYKSEDYREPVRRQILTSSEPARASAVPRQNETQLSSLGALGQEFTFRISTRKSNEVTAFTNARWGDADNVLLLKSAAPLVSAGDGNVRPVEYSKP